MQNKTAHLARRQSRLLQVPALSAQGTEIGSKTCTIVHYIVRNVIVVYRVCQFLSEGKNACTLLNCRYKKMYVVLILCEIFWQSVAVEEHEEGILLFNDLCTEWLGDTLKFVLRPNIIFVVDWAQSTNQLPAVLNARLDVCETSFCAGR